MFQRGSYDLNVVIRTTLNDAIAAEQIFTDLMGDNVDPRKEFIHANAKFVKNLDI